MVDDLSPHEFFASLPGRADPQKIAGVAHTYLFDIEGKGRWLVDVRDGKVTVAENPQDPVADVTFTMSAETFERIQARKQSPMTAYVTRKLKVTGDIGAAMTLQRIL
jgi:putative sterol carrier protein